MIEELSSGIRVMESPSFLVKLFKAVFPQCILSSRQICLILDPVSWGQSVDQAAANLNLFSAAQFGLQGLSHLQVISQVAGTQQSHFFFIYQFFACILSNVSQHPVTVYPILQLLPPSEMEWRRDRDGAPVGVVHWRAPDAMLALTLR